MPSFSCSTLLVALPGSRTLLGMPFVRILDRWHGLTRYVRNLGRDKEQVRTIRPQKHVRKKKTRFAFIYWIAYLIKRMIHSSGRILRPGRQMWKSSKWSWLPGSHWFSSRTRHTVDAGRMGKLGRLIQFRFGLIDQIYQMWWCLVQDVLPFGGIVHGSDDLAHAKPTQAKDWDDPVVKPTWYTVEKKWHDSCRNWDKDLHSPSLNHFKDHPGVESEIWWDMGLLGNGAYPPNGSKWPFLWGQWW